MSTECGNTERFFSHFSLREKVLKRLIFPHTTHQTTASVLRVDCTLLHLVVPSHPPTPPPPPSPSPTASVSKITIPSRRLKPWCTPTLNASVSPLTTAFARFQPVPWSNPLTPRLHTPLLPPPFPQPFSPEYAAFPVEQRFLPGCSHRDNHVGTIQRRKLSRGCRSRPANAAASVPVPLRATLRKFNTL